MLLFLLSRVRQSLILLVLVSMIGFAVLHLAPGGPLSQFTSTPGMKAEDLARISAMMGLDRPIPIQYLEWGRRLLLGDWGRSYRDGRPVLAIIAEHLPATLLLMGTATAISMTVGSFVGIQGAIRRHTVFDYASTVGAMVALSIPTFWLGLVAIYVFSLKLGWFPAGNMSTIGDASAGDTLWHLVLPALVLAVVDVAVWSRYMRAATLGVIHQDFVRTARAKGLSQRRVLVKHVVGNALLPMITLAGLQVPALLGGALVTETVFTWPGMGRLFLDSLSYSDYPVIMGLLMISALLVLTGNLVSDFLVSIADPRIRLG